MSPALPGTVSGSKVQSIVAIGDLAVVGSRSSRLVTHALGSCIGLTLYDRAAGVGGLLHFMLPSSSDGDSLAVQPWAYATSGIPALFKTAYALGADKSRLVVCAAGGAELSHSSDGLSIGKRNHTVLRKLLWKNGITLAAEDVGGEIARTLELDMSSGSVLVRAGGASQVLWQS